MRADQSASPSLERSSRESNHAINAIAIKIPTMYRFKESPRERSRKQACTIDRSPLLLPRKPARAHQDRANLANCPSIAFAKLNADSDKGDGMGIFVCFDDATLVKPLFDRYKRANVRADREGSLEQPLL